MGGASATSSKRLPADTRRRQILDATATIIAEHGFEAISIQSVAREAGISRPVVYDHFGDLRGLQEALVEREMELALEQVSATALESLDSGDPTELMLKSLSAFLDTVEQHPETWRLVLVPPEGAPKILRSNIREGRGKVLKGMSAAVRSGLRPDDAAEDPELTARTLSAIADEYARLILADPVRYPAARLLDHARWFLGELSTPLSAQR